MPTRRILELMVVVSLCVRPAFGMARLWAVKTFQAKPAGTVSHGVAEIVSVVV